VVSYTPVKGTDYFDGVNGISAYTSALNGGFVGTEAQWIASLVSRGSGASALTDQKFIVYPADFVGTNYTILMLIKERASYNKRRYCGYYNTSSSSVKVQLAL
jgi:hypothetical protein